MLLSRSGNEIPSGELDSNSVCVRCRIIYKKTFGHWIYNDIETKGKEKKLQCGQTRESNYGVIKKNPEW